MQRRVKIEWDVHCRIIHSFGHRCYKKERRIASSNTLVYPQKKFCAYRDGIFIGIIYKSGSVENPTWLSPHWLGILGINGWAYLLCATIFLFAGEKIIYAITILLIFHALNALEFITLFGGQPDIKLMGASNHATVMSGILASLLYLIFGMT